jgi:hypothetical protein
MTIDKASDRQSWKLRLVFTSKSGHSGRAAMQQMVAKFCETFGGNISRTFCKRITEGVRASFYFMANDDELANLLKLLSDFVKKNDVQKMNLEKVDTEIAAQQFAKDESAK